MNRAEKSMLRSSLICTSGVGTRSSCCTLARRLPDRLGGMLTRVLYNNCTYERVGLATKRHIASATPLLFVAMS